MARLPELNTREALPPEAQPHFDAIAGSRGRVGGPFAVMLHSPEVAGRAAHLGTYLRFESDFDPMLRELATLVAARECDCEYEWAAHVPQAQQAGARQAAIDAIANGGDVRDLSDDEALIVRFGRGLLRRHRVDERTFEAARARFGERGVIDLTALFGYYSMLACLLNATQVAPVPGSAPLQDLPQD